MEPPEQRYVLEPRVVAPGSRRRRRTVVVGLALLGIVAIVGIAGSRLVVPPARPGPLVALITPDGRLTLVDALGRERRSWVADGTPVPFPAWSPDGTRIALMASSPAGGTMRVYPAPAGGTAATDRGTGADGGTIVYRSAVAAPFYAYWAPDARTLGFLTVEPDGGLALRLAAADGGGPDTVLRRGAPMYWAWLDPARLLVHSGDASDGTGPFLGEVTTDGSAGPGVTPGPGPFRAPAVSGHGQWEAWEDDVAGSMSVVVAARGGGSRCTVTVFGPAAMGFDPGGPRLAFIASADPSSRSELPVGPLRVLDPVSCAIRTPVSGQVVAFFWAPDGRTIAALSAPASPGGGNAAAAAMVLARMPATPAHPAAPSHPSAPVPLVAVPGFDLHLSFVDPGSGAVHGERAVRVSALFVDQLLPYFDQYALSHRLWSPDGTSLVLPLVAADGAPSIELAFADGTTPRPLGSDIAGFWSP